MLTEQTLRALWPHGDDRVPGLIAGIAAAAPAVFEKYGLTTPTAVAQAMAQFSHECGAGNEMEENVSYTASRIVAVWPSRFSSTAAALPYARNPRKLADKVYGDRMGNQPGTDDGYNFRGRGLSQVTGREGYTKLAAKAGLDLLGDPDLVNDPAHALECGVADFILCGCLPFALKDDVRGVTHHLNGGYIGLAERTAWLAKWKRALAAETPARPADGTIRYGDRGWEVEALQHQLTALGYGAGAADGDFGAATRGSVLAFQANENLPTTGIVDQATREALSTAPAKPVAEERANATVDDLIDQGSQVATQADNSNKVAKAGMAIGGVVAVDQVGAIDQAKNLVDHFGGPKPALDLVQQVVEWAGAHLWVALVGGAGLAWYFGRGAIAARLADHRSGTNMGR